jgi:hypothetical protein
MFDRCFGNQHMIKDNLMTVIDHEMNIPKADILMEEGTTYQNLMMKKLP